MTRIKICGITNLADALAATELGAHALGFIFAESPRRVSPEAAQEIIRQLPPFMTKIGVFVNESIETVKTLFTDCGLNAVQLHGDEDCGYLEQLSIPIIKAFRVKDESVLTEIESFGLPHFLLDTFDKQARGGTGRSFNWQIARKAARHGRVILSGGLDDINVAEALSIARPFAVDAGSGLEIEPGRKDHVKLKQFIHEVQKWDNRTGAAISAHTAAASFLKR